MTQTTRLPKQIMSWQWIECQKRGRPNITKKRNTIAYDTLVKSNLLYESENWRHC